MVVSTEEAVDPGTTGTEGFGRDVQQLAAYFYAGDGILVSTCAACLQRGFDTLTELFHQVGLERMSSKQWVWSDIYDRWSECGQTKTIPGG